MNRTFVPASILLAPLAAFALWAPEARAACESDTECAKGFSCEVVGASGCAAPACPPGEKCPLPPECEPKEFRECIPSMDCSSDADCADGMVCHEMPGAACGGAGFAAPCPPDRECPPPPPEMCQSSTQHACVPRQVLPCETASDCGEGFTCEAPVVCGSDPTMPQIDPARAGDVPPPEGEHFAADAGAPMPEERPTGDCKPAGEKMCRPMVKECKASEECPKGWSCGAPPTAACGGTAMDRPMAGAGGASGAGGAPSAEPPIQTQPKCDVPPAAAVCIPPFAQNMPGGSGASGMPTRDAEQPTYGHDDVAGSTKPPANPGNNGQSPSGSSSTESGASDGATQPSVPSFHCAVGTGVTSSPLSWCALGLALLGIARRRAR